MRRRVLQAWREEGIGEWVVVLVEPRCLRFGRGRGLVGAGLASTNTAHPGCAVSVQVKTRVEDPARTGCDQRGHLERRTTSYRRRRSLQAGRLVSVPRGVSSVGWAVLGLHRTSRLWSMRGCDVIWRARPRRVRGKVMTST